MLKKMILPIVFIANFMRAEVSSENVALIKEIAQKMGCTEYTVSKMTYDYIKAYPDHGLIGIATNQQFLVNEDIFNKFDSEAKKYVVACICCTLNPINTIKFLSVSVAPDLGFMGLAYLYNKFVNKNDKSLKARFKAAVIGLLGSIAKSPFSNTSWFNLGKWQMSVAIKYSSKDGILSFLNHQEQVIKEKVDKGLLLQSDLDNYINSVDSIKKEYCL